MCFLRSTTLPTAISHGPGAAHRHLPPPPAYMMPNMHGASVVVPDDAVEGETPATATAVDDGVVIQGYVIGAEPVASSSLADMADLFRRQLNLSGNVVEVVDAACAQLGVPGSGPLVDRAARCRGVLDGTAAAATASAVAVEGKAFDGDDLAALVRELPSKAWSGGKDAGSWSGEAYAKNPWRFDGDGTFTTERDGCHGAWTVRRDLDRLVLRMDWRGAQEGNYAEFAPGQHKRAKFPTSKAPISAIFHSFWLIFGRAIISRSGLEAWMLFPERARAEHSR